MEQVLQQFCLDGTPISCEPLGNGHINRTFRVVCDNRKAYTLQRINRVAFRHPEELIENIDAVSRFIDRKQIGLECIRLCRAKDVLARLQLHLRRHQPGYAARQKRLLPGRGGLRQVPAGAGGFPGGLPV